MKRATALASLRRVNLWSSDGATAIFKAGDDRGRFVLCLLRTVCSCPSIIRIFVLQISYEITYDPENFIAYCLRSIIRILALCTLVRCNLTFQRTHPYFSLVSGGYKYTIILCISALQCSGEAASAGGQKRKLEASGAAVQGALSGTIMFFTIFLHFVCLSSSTNLRHDR